MDRNLGASQVATAVNDELSFGDYYQWGNANPAGTKTSTNGVWDTDGGNASNLSWNGGTEAAQDDPSWNATKGSQDPCPTGFRVPTVSEWRAEQDQGGTNEWGTGDTTTPFFSILKLPFAGYRHFNGIYHTVEGGYFYWNSTTVAADPTEAFARANYSYSRNHGFPIRCIKQ